MIVFVGEKPSKTAFEKGWTWESKRLASATLHDALDRIGYAEPVQFMNLFGDHPEDREALTDDRRLTSIKAHVKDGRVIVAMGKKVSRILSAKNVPHRMIVHPAARGKIRAKDVYAEHLREALRV